MNVLRPFPMFDEKAEEPGLTSYQGEAPELCSDWSVIQGPKHGESSTLFVRMKRPQGRGSDISF